MTGRNDAYEPGRWYVDAGGGNLEGCASIEAREKNIALHVDLSDAEEIVAAHNGREELVMLLTRYEAMLTIQKGKADAIVNEYVPLPLLTVERARLQSQHSIILAEMILLQDVVEALRRSGIKTDRG